MIQVEVVTQFNEDGFSFGLAQGMADRIRNALADVRCAEHEEESWVRVSTQGTAQVPNDLHVEIGGCCPAVIEKVEKIVSQVRESGDQAGGAE